MGTSERKEREKAELRCLILDKAKEIFIRDGQDGLSIRKIANEIEYSPTTIYTYFEDKDELLHHLMEQGFELLTKFMEGVMKIEDPILRVKEMGRQYIIFGRKNPDWYNIMFHSKAPINHIQRCKEDWCAGISFFEFFVFTCKQACEASQNTMHNERVIALQLWSLTHGLICLDLAHRLDVVTESSHETLIEDTVNATMKIYFNI